MEERERLVNAHGVEQRQRLSKTESINQRNGDSVIHSVRKIPYKGFQCTVCTRESNTLYMGKENESAPFI
jgi:hypothetical protein